MQHDIHRVFERHYGSRGQPLTASQSLHRILTYEHRQRETETHIARGKQRKTEVATNDALLTDLLTGNAIWPSMVALWCLPST